MKKALPPAARERYSALHQQACLAKAAEFRADPFLQLRCVAWRSLSRPSKKIADPKLLLGLSRDRHSMIATGPRSRKAPSR